MVNLVCTVYIFRLFKVQKTIQGIQIKQHKYICVLYSANKRRMYNVYSIPKGKQINGNKFNLLL